MKNSTFFVPQYKRKWIREKKDYGPWETILVPISGTMHNGWIIFYDRSMRLWKVLHPEINEYLVRTKTKDAAIAIAKVVEPDLFSIEFGEVAAISKGPAWEFVQEKLLSCEIVEPITKDPAKGIFPSTVWKEKE